MLARSGLLAATMSLFGWSSLFVPPLTTAAERPFVLWRSEELEAIRRRIETEPWAAAEWRRKPENRAEASLHDLLAWRLFGDREAGARQVKRLLAVVRSRPPLGGAQWVNVVIYDMAHDLLTDAERTEVERTFRGYIDQAIFRNALFDPEEFNLSRDYQRYDAEHYTRTNWLPNIVWPRRLSANLMAVALGEEALVRRVWDHYGSWRWYFDEYLSADGFYGEEFSKMGATPGEMIVYCRAVRNLGLDDLGFGYRGCGGATMRVHVGSVIRLGYPRIELHSGRPQYPMITTGDVRGDGSSRQGKNLPTFAFQHSIVRGFLPDIRADARIDARTDAPTDAPTDTSAADFPGTAREANRGTIQKWQAHGAWGGEMRGDNPQWDGYGDFTPKMQIPLWLEAAHAEWPEDRLDYFLAWTRTPQEERYTPSLYFGVAPMAPADTRPPRAPSWVAEDRGLAMLRAEESPAYWESPAPAVGVRLGANYAHNVNDSLTLSGFYAFGRPIFLNRQTRRGYAFGYSRSVLSHAGVLVGGGSSDGGEPGFTDDVATRHGFYPEAKFLMVASPRVYRGIEATRALVLTGRYLLDAFLLEGTDGRERDFVWTVHALGLPEIPPREVSPRGVRGTVELDGPLAVFGEAVEMGGETAGTDSRGVTVIQRLALDDPSKARLPKEWYDRRVGVRISVDAGPGTRLFVARTPTDDPENRKLEDPEADLGLEEVGGTSVIARRKAPGATFLAFHLPFEGGSPPPLGATRHATGSERVIAVEVTDAREDSRAPRMGRGPGEWILLDIRSEEERREPCAIELPAGERIAFSSHAFVRVDPRGVHVWGDVLALRLEVPPTENTRPGTTDAGPDQTVPGDEGPDGKGPTFTHNGRATRSTLEGRWMTYPARGR